MPLEESEQREWKARLLGEALSRIGRLDDLPIEPLRAPGTRLGYRNRIELTWTTGGGTGARLGLHGPAPDRALVDVERCLLQDDASNAVLATLRELLVGDGAAEVTSGRLTLRRSETSGEILVVLRETHGRLAHAGELARRIVARRPEVVGVVRVHAPARRRGGARAETLAGKPWIEERFAGMTFRLPATTFVQVSRAGAELLVDLVAECALDPAPRHVLDLYCGVGVYALSLVGRGVASATACDADGAALDCGREAAARHGRNVEFHRGRVERLLAGRVVRETVVANPPRAGLGLAVARTLGRSRASRIVLVSCDPATLGRDLAELARAGFRSRRVVPVDLFPQTAHVEAVVLLER